MAAAPRELIPMVGGSSISSLSMKRTILTIFNKHFRTHPEMIDKYPKDFEDLDNKTLTSRELYGLVATYLTDIYKNTAGEHIAGSSAIIYFNGLLGIAQAIVSERTPGDDKAKYFFTCRNLKAGTEHSTWCAGLRDTIIRKSFHRAVKNGNVLDNSAPPISIHHIMAFIKALSMQNTAVAAKRKFEIFTLWAAAGRAAETSYLTFDGMSWDSFLKCIFMEVPQLKTAKAKQIAFVAGENRHSCFYLGLADFFTMQCNFDSFFAFESEESVPWLFPDLEASKSPGTILSNYLKEFAENDRDPNCVWPLDVSACSLRHGGISLLVQSMPCEIAVHTTGHKLENVGSIWEYSDTPYSTPPYSYLPGTLTPSLLATLIWWGLN